MRRAANIDVNHKQIKSAFEGMGCTVLDLFRVGDDCPDLLVGVAGVNLLVEVKRNDNGPKAAELTEGQKAWHAKWRGQSCKITTVEEAVTLVKAVRSWKGVSK